jgi:hypothetical protein
MQAAFICSADMTTLVSHDVPKNVALMLGFSSHWGGRRPIERDSHNTVGFSARKSCVKKRQREGVWDERSRHNSVLSRRVSK